MMSVNIKYFEASSSSSVPFCTASCVIPLVSFQLYSHFTGTPVSSILLQNVFTRIPINTCKWLKWCLNSFTNPHAFVSLPLKDRRSISLNALPFNAITIRLINFYYLLSLFLDN